MTDKTKEALKLALDWIEGNGKYDAAKRIAQAIREALADQPAIKQDLTPEQPDMNLSCKSVQARLATSWGYVKAEQPAPVAESRKPQHEPVAVVSGYYGGQCVILPTNPARLFNSGTALYTSPPANKPLTDEQIEFIRVDQEFTEWAISEAAFRYAARAIEAAHSIKGDA